jgi:hypothetical protein
LLRITKLESVFEICDAASLSEETEEDRANADPVTCCAQA